MVPSALSHLPVKVCASAVSSDRAGRYACLADFFLLKENDFPNLYSRAEQPLNILLIFFTFCILKEDISSELRREHALNILFILRTFFVSKPDKLIETSFEHLLNIESMLVALLVLNPDASRALKFLQFLNIQIGRAHV